MERAEVSTAIKEYIRRELLRTEDDELSDETPLLEWGVIDSIAMVGLVTFIENKWKIALPSAEVSPANFSTVTTLCDMVLRLAKAAPAKSAG